MIKRKNTNIISWIQRNTRTPFADGSFIEQRLDSAFSVSILAQQEGNK